MNYDPENAGNILLGVNDNGDVIGINQKVLPQIKKYPVTTLNNTQKISPPLYIMPEEFKISGKINY
ncbi:MAG: hypothetical protein ABIA63_09585 [bacterium]